MPNGFCEWCPCDDGPCVVCDSGTVAAPPREYRVGDTVTLTTDREFLRWTVVGVVREEVADGFLPPVYRLRCGGTVRPYCPAGLIEGVCP